MLKIIRVTNLMLLKIFQIYVVQLNLIIFHHAPDEDAAQQLKSYTIYLVRKTLNGH